MLDTRTYEIPADRYHKTAHANRPRILFATSGGGLFKQGGTWSEEKIWDVLSWSDFDGIGRDPRAPETWRRMAIICPTQSEEEIRGTGFREAWEEWAETAEINRCVDLNVYFEHGNRRVQEAFGHPGVKLKVEIPIFGREFFGSHGSPRLAWMALVQWMLQAQPGVLRPDLSKWEQTVEHVVSPADHFADGHAAVYATTRSGIAPVREAVLLKSDGARAFTLPARTRLTGSRRS